MVPRLHPDGHNDMAIGVFDEIQRFIETHQRCGRVSGAVDVPGADGYGVKIRCACGESLERWVSVESARYDLVFSTLLCNPN
jgi:hypothetical protein